MQQVHIHGYLIRIYKKMASDRIVTGNQLQIGQKK